MTGLSILFNMKTEEACYVYGHMDTHRRANEQSMQMKYPELLSPGRQRNHSDSRYTGSPDLSNYRSSTYYNNVTAPRYRQQYGYSNRESHPSYPDLTGSLYSDGGSMSNYTKSYDNTNRNYDITGKSQRLFDRGKFENPDVAAPKFEFGISYTTPKTQETNKSYDTSTKDYDITSRTDDINTRTDDVTLRRSPARTTSLSDKSRNQPSHAEAPVEYPARRRQRHNSGDSTSSVSSEKSEDRSLLNALKQRYKENAERQANDPATRAPFSTWRRSGHFDEVATSTSHDAEKDKTQSKYETGDYSEKDKTNLTGSSLSERDSHHEEKLQRKEQTTENKSEPTPDDLLYNFRKALCRHHLSEYDKDTDTRQPAEEATSQTVHMEDNMEGKLERLRAARAKLQEKRSGDKPRPVSFASEFKIKPEPVQKVESNKTEDSQPKAALEIEQSKDQQKSAKLSRQKLVSDDLKAKYSESKKEESDKESLTRKRLSLRSKHEEHMEHWSKEKDKLEEIGVKEKVDSVPTVEEMLGTHKPQDRSPSYAATKFQNVDHSSPFGAVYTKKPAQTVSPPPSQPSTLSQETGKTSLEAETTVTQAQPVQQQPVMDKKQSKSSGRKLKKYTKSKSLELGALGVPEPIEEPVKVEYQDDSNLPASLDDLSQASRLERINRYKEERKRQIAAISNKFDSTEKELPSLFLSSKSDDSSVQRSKSMRVQSDTKPESSVTRSKSLKHERETIPETRVAQSSGLKLAEIGDQIQPDSSKQKDTDKSVNTERIIEKLHALKKIREEHLRGTSGLTIEELQSKRASKEMQSCDETSSIDSYSSRTLLADKVPFDSSSLRVPGRDSERSSSTERGRSGDTSRESTPKVRSLSEKSESSALKSKLRTFSEKSGDDSQRKNLFEFGTVYTKKSKDSDRSRTPSERDEESGRESVDSHSRIRRKLPSIEDVLGTSEEEAFESVPRKTPDRDSTPTAQPMTKEIIADMKAEEIQRRKTNKNIERARAKFKDDSQGYGVFGVKYDSGTNYDMGTKYTSKTPDELSDSESIKQAKLKAPDQVDLVDRSIKDVDLERTRKEMLGIDSDMKDRVSVETPQKTAPVNVRGDIDPVTGLHRIRQKYTRSKTSRSPSREISEERVTQKQEVSQAKMTLSEVREKSEEKQFQKPRIIQQISSESEEKQTLRQRLVQQFSSEDKTSDQIPVPEKEKPVSIPPASPKVERRNRIIAEKFNKTSNESIQFGTVYSAKKEDTSAIPSSLTEATEPSPPVNKTSVTSIKLSTQKSLESDTSDVEKTVRPSARLAQQTKRMSPVRTVVDPKVAVTEEARLAKTFSPKAEIAKIQQVQPELVVQNVPCVIEHSKQQLSNEPVSILPVSALTYQPPEWEAEETKQKPKSNQPVSVPTYEPPAQAKVIGGIRQEATVSKPISFAYEPQVAPKAPAGAKPLQKEPEIQKAVEAPRPVSFAYEPAVSTKKIAEKQKEPEASRTVSFAYEPSVQAKKETVPKKDTQEIAKPVSSFAYEPTKPQKKQTVLQKDPEAPKPVSFAYEPAAPAKKHTETRQGEAPKPFSFAYEPAAPAKKQTETRQVEAPKPVSFAYEPAAQTKKQTETRQGETPKPVSFAYEPAAQTKNQAETRKETETTKPISSVIEPAAQAKKQAESRKEAEVSKQPVSFAVPAKEVQEEKREPESEKPKSFSFEAPRVITNPDQELLNAAIAYKKQAEAAKLKAKQQKSAQKQEIKQEQGDPRPAQQATGVAKVKVETPVAQVPTKPAVVNVTQPEPEVSSLEAIRGVKAQLAHPEVRKEPAPVVQAPSDVITADSIKEVRAQLARPEVKKEAAPVVQAASDVITAEAIQEVKAHLAHPEVKRDAAPVVQQASDVVTAETIQEIKAQLASPEVKKDELPSPAFSKTEPPTLEELLERAKEGEGRKSEEDILKSESDINVEAEHTVLPSLTLEHKLKKRTEEEEEIARAKRERDQKNKEDRTVAFIKVQDEMLAKKKQMEKKRGRKVERAKSAKGKLEKSVLTKVRVESQLQDTTSLDDILDKNVDYLSDMEPPDFSKLGQKSRPISTHERHKTKRSLKKKSLSRSKSEDRSHFKVPDSDEDVAVARTTDDLKSTSFKLRRSRGDRAVTSRQDGTSSKQAPVSSNLSRSVPKNVKSLEPVSYVSPVTQSELQTGPGSRLNMSQVNQSDPNRSYSSVSDTVYRKYTPGERTVGTDERVMTLTSTEVSGTASDTSERSDRHYRRVLNMADSSRESETSRITTDSDHSVSSAMSEGSRKRRKDKSSLRKSKLNESEEDAVSPVRRRESTESRVSRSSVRRVASSRLAREPPPDQQNRDEEFDVLKQHDLEISVIKRDNTVATPTSSSSSTVTSGTGDKPLCNLDLKHVNNTDSSSRLVHKTPLDSHSVLPSRFALPSKVSSAISKLSEASEKSSRDSSPLLKKEFSHSPRGLRRENNFSKLLQKFSGSEASSSEKSDTESPRVSRVHLKRQEAYPGSSGSSDDTRRTPERTQSLKLRKSESGSVSDRDSSSSSSLQRSSSFKSDFMKRRFSPDPENRRRLPEAPSEQSDKPSPELASVLSKRNVIVAKQQEEGEDLERKRIHDGRVEKAENFTAAKNDDVIADNEVLKMLRSRRKETDSSLEQSSVSESETKSQNINLTPSIVPQISSTVITSTKQKNVEKDTQPSQPTKMSQNTQPKSLASQSSFESKTSITLSSPPPSQVVDPPLANSHITDTPKPARVESKTQVPKLDLSSIDTSLAVLKSVSASTSDTSTNKDTNVEKALSNVNITSPTQVVQFIKSVESTVKPPQREVSESVQVRQDSVQTSGPPSTHPPPSQDEPSMITTTTPGAIDITSKSEIRKKISREGTPERHSPLRSIPMKVTSPMKATSGLTRTESIGRTESERPKGILKRTPSLKQAGVIVDPELAEVLKSRRHRQNDVDEEEAQEKLTAEEEIQKERENQANKDAPVERELSVAERVFHMHNKIEEIRSCPITPRRSSGLSTPHALLQQSGSVTPKFQPSFDNEEQQQPLSGSQLIERLTSLEGQQTPSVSEKRRYFQQTRKRNDWRTRTQPVTLFEIQQADGLETVRKFRSEVNQKSSVGLFEELQHQDKPAAVSTKKIEYPQHVKHERRQRGERHKTLPITAAELNAIPEGQISGTTNTLKKKFETLGARDSKGDSGILSGSEGDNISRDSDSWRSLSMDEKMDENDPVKLSVSAKASMFLQMQESIKEQKEKRSASGAKRYIDRKKRERSRTLPITEDEVKLAAEIADEENKETAQQQQQQQQQQQSEVPSELTEAESDELSRQSLKDKVKLFTTIEEEKKVAAQKKGVVPPPPKRRNRKFASRFATQPVTIEEVEKAAKISPLACSLVKPPDPDILSGLSVKAQRELIAQHAEKTLSQPGSRSGSRPTSRSTSVTDLTVGVLNADALTATNTAVNENVADWTPADRVRPSDVKASGFTIVKQEETKVQTVEKIESNLDSKRKSILKSELEEKLSLSLHHDPKGILKPKADAVPTLSDIKSVLKKESTVERTRMEVKSILKKEGSFETRKVDVTSEYSAIKSSDTETGGDTSDALESDTKDTGEGIESSGDNLDSDEGILDSGVVAPTKSPVQHRKSKDKRRFNRDRKLEAERYRTQPAESTSQGDAGQKKKYVGRHLTQPITPDEKKTAEDVTAMPEIQKTGSITDRLSALKKNGEEGWRKRVSKPDDLDSLDRRSLSPPSTPPNYGVKMREKKNLDTPRPTSIADRLSLLDNAQTGWRERIGETDVKKFTIEHKISASGHVVGESPLVARLKGRGLKKELSGDSDSSEYSDLPSPSSPTKDSNKIPMPQEVVCTDIPPELLKVDTKSPLTSIKSQEEEDEKRGSVNVEIPDVSAEMDTFFIKREVIESSTSEKIDVSINDFDELFLSANDILETTKKIKPKRRHNPSSRNPMKTMSMCLDIKSEYTEVLTGVAERELKRQKTAAISQNSGFAVEALAGLASKENFAKVELRKTESTGTGRLDPYQPLMLIHIKGRRKVQCRLVEPSAKSLNSGDCFVLITPDKNIMWCGDYCNVIEKAKAADFCDQVKTKRDLGCKGARDITIIEEKKSRHGAGRHFWDLIGGHKDYMSSGPPEEDELYENHIVETNMIFRMEDNKLVPEQDCWGSQPKYEMLKKDQVYVFDFGSEVYLWQGKSVSPNQRKISLKLAEQIWNKGYNYKECDINPLSPLRTEEEGGLPVTSDTRPDWALFGKVNQNMETILFREKFADWPDTSRLIKAKSTEDGNSSKADIQDLKPYDATLMVPVNTKPVTLVLEGSNVGRGNQWEQDMDGFMQTQLIETLKVRIWHVLEYDHYEIEPHSFGQFHEGDTYVIRWQYMIVNAGMKSLKGHASRHGQMGRERCAYFFWQGKTSTINEKGASALMTVELDEERGPQIRVDEGKEPACFLNLFKGRMIIHIGKREEEETNTVGPWKFYCLRNEYENEICLIEVPRDIANLRSVSSFLLLNVKTGRLVVWHGCKSPEHTKKLGLAAAEFLKEKCPMEVGLHKGKTIDINEMNEGEEGLEFWRIANVTRGNREAFNSLLNNPESFSHTLRLFHMTSVSGVFEAQEVVNPTRTPDLPTKFPVLQTDLYKVSQPALFLVDNGHEVFLWQGWLPEGDEEQENVLTGSAVTRFTTERRCAMETTIQYCKEICPDNPPPAYMVYAGLEPLSFTNLFPLWTVEENVQEINLRAADWDVSLSLTEEAKDGKLEGEQVLVEDLLKKLSKTRYSLAELLETPPPEGVDPLKLESYLCDEEFEAVLEMTRDEFYALPNWKQSKMKQQAGLY